MSSTAPRPVRLGIAGCGRLTERGYLPACRALEEIHLAALAEPDAERRTRAVELVGRARCDPPRPYADLAAMLAAGSLDAVVIATPSDQHVATAEEVARAGLPCLVEKPPAPDLAAAERLAALAPAPWIGFNRRFLQGAELRGRMPAEGWLELDLALEFQRDGWGAHAARDDALLDAGSHLVDLAAFLTGSRAIAVRDAQVDEDRAHVEVELGRARAKIRCATDRPYCERVTVRDRGGQTIAAWRLGRLQALAGRLRGRPEPLVRSLTGQLAALARAVRDDDAGQLARAADGVAAMRVLAATRRSAALGGAEVLVARDADPEAAQA